MKVEPGQVFRVKRAVPILYTHNLGDPRIVGFDELLKIGPIQQTNKQGTTYYRLIDRTHWYVADIDISNCCEADYLELLYQNECPHFCNDKKEIKDTEDNIWPCPHCSNKPLEFTGTNSRLEIVD